MKNTEFKIDEMMQKAIEVGKETLEVCNKEIEHLSHPEIYGCCLSRCNSIVINKERIMTITTDDNHMTTYEFAPRYPTYFSPEAAKRIVENDIYRDINDEVIKLDIIGKLEYYQLLKEHIESNLNRILSMTV